MRTCSRVSRANLAWGQEGGLGQIWVAGSGLKIRSFKAKNRRCFEQVGSELCSGRRKTYKPSADKDDHGWGHVLGQAN